MTKLIQSKRSNALSYSPLLWLQSCDFQEVLQQLHALSLSADYLLLPVSTCFLCVCFCCFFVLTVNRCTERLLHWCFIGKSKQPHWFSIKNKDLLSVAPTQLKDNQRWTKFSRRALYSCSFPVNVKPLFTLHMWSNVLVLVLLSKHTWGASLKQDVKAKQESVGSSTWYNLSSATDFFFTFFFF